MSELLFSVIVPVYNAENYLNNCLDSILNQSYLNYELLIIDDGSTDGSLEICNGYQEKDQRVKVLHKENGGLVSARQYAVQFIRGEYCVSVDSDDWVDINYLLDFSKIIEKYHPDLICSGLISTDGDTAKEYHPQLAEGFYRKKEIETCFYPGLIQDKNAKCYDPNICSKAIKTSIYKEKQLLVDPRIRNGEDATCTRACFLTAESIYVVDHSYYFYRVNRESMTKKRKPYPWNQKKLVVENLKRFIDLEQFDFQDQLYRSIVHGEFLIYVSQFYSDKSYFEVRKEICDRLKDPQINEALQKSQFNSFGAKMMRFALKHRMIFLLYVFSLRR